MANKLAGGQMFYKTGYDSPVGRITLAADDGGRLVGLWIEGQRHFGGTVLDAAIENDGLEIFGRVQRWLDEYFAGRAPDASQIPMAPIGGEFRQSVWAALRRIPYGKTVTYGDVAKTVGRGKMSARAVGGAVAHNPISIIIPCHRVVGAGGALTGYAGGIGVKAALLSHEGAPII